MHGLQGAAALDTVPEETTQRPDLFAAHAVSWAPELQQPEGSGTTAGAAHNNCDGGTSFAAQWLPPPANICCSLASSSSAGAGDQVSKHPMMQTQQCHPFALSAVPRGTPQAWLTLAL